MRGRAAATTTTTTVFALMGLVGCGIAACDEEETPATKKEGKERPSLVELKGSFQSDTNKVVLELTGPAGTQFSVTHNGKKQRNLRKIGADGSARIELPPFRGKKSAEHPERLCVQPFDGAKKAKQECVDVTVPVEEKVSVTLKAAGGGLLPGCSGRLKRGSAKRHIACSPPSARGDGPFAAELEVVVAAGSGKAITVGGKKATFDKGKATLSLPFLKLLGEAPVSRLFSRGKGNSAGGLSLPVTLVNGEGTLEGALTLGGTPTTNAILLGARKGGVKLPTGGGPRDTVVMVKLNDKGTPTYAPHLLVAPESARFAGGDVGVVSSPPREEGSPCKYELGKAKGQIKRVRQNLEAKAYDLRSGEVVGSKTFRAPLAKCPKTMTADIRKRYSSGGSLRSSPSLDALTSWAKGLL